MAEGYTPISEIDPDLFDEANEINSIYDDVIEKGESKEQAAFTVHEVIKHLDDEDIETIEDAYDYIKLRDELWDEANEINTAYDEMVAQGRPPQEIRDFLESRELGIPPELLKPSEKLKPEGNQLVIIFGPPRAGKGSVSKALVQKLNEENPDLYVDHVNTDNLRNLVKLDVLQEIAQELQNGELNLAFAEDETEETRKLVPGYPTKISQKAFNNEVNKRLYSAERREEVYDLVYANAAQVLEQGGMAILDATNLTEGKRQAAVAKVAEKLNTPPEEMNVTYIDVVTTKENALARIRSEEEIAMETLAATLDVVEKGISPASPEYEERDTSEATPATVERDIDAREYATVPHIRIVNKGSLEDLNKKVRHIVYEFPKTQN